jgi:hypothetical protein
MRARSRGDAGGEQASAVSGDVPEVAAARATRRGCADEPAEDRERERHEVGPARIVREEDLRQHDADDCADERSYDAGHDGHNDE